jgi:hypothetical protein
MTAKLGYLSDREKSVVETIRMRLNVKQSLEYLKEVGFDISERTLRRDRRKVESLKLKRLYHIAKIGFQDQHLETIDQYEMGFKMMWQNVLRERDPYKQNVMIKDILLLKPYLSAYYEATKLIIDKQQSEYKEFLNKHQQQEEQQWQLQEDNEEEMEQLTGDNNDKPEFNKEYDPNRKF